jgi:hypothetical protein
MEELMIDKLNELCLWLSHQKGMMSQDYAKELAKIIVRLRQQADRIAELENKARFIQNFAEEQHKRACDLENKPVKQLSDEEIMKHSYLTSDNDPIAFARAIIKASRGEEC